MFQFDWETVFLHRVGEARPNAGVDECERFGVDYDSFFASLDRFDCFFDHGLCLSLLAVGVSNSWSSEVVAGASKGRAVSGSRWYFTVFVVVIPSRMPTRAELVLPLIDAH